MKAVKMQIGGKNGKPKVDIHERTYRFALRVIKLVQELPKNMVAMELGRQLLRSATSIAANIEEAQGGFSKQDFTYKVSIAFKEAKETNFWLRLICDAGIEGMNMEGENRALIQESHELKNILAKIVKTSKERT